MQIYYLENLDHPLNDNNHRMVVPRAAVFSKQYISTLTNADRWADKDDRICYGKLRVRFIPLHHLKNILYIFVF
jgi:hypothetical protein